jgi:hypothetical protein
VVAVAVLATRLPGGTVQPQPKPRLPPAVPATIPLPSRRRTRRRTRKRRRKTVMRAIPMLVAEMLPVRVVVLYT